MKLPALWCVPATSQKVRLTSKGVQQQIWPVPSRILFENIGYCYIFFKSMAWLSKIQTSFWEVKPRISSVQFSSVAQSCLTLCDPMNCSTPGLPVHHQQLEFTKPMSMESVMPSNHLILCHPLLLPSIFPSIRVFSSESALRIRWPKYWSFSFNISPSSEHPGLISFRMWELDCITDVKHFA